MSKTRTTHKVPWDFIENMWETDTCKDEQYVGRSRWAVQYLVIFEYEGRMLGCTRSVPATELQETGSLEDDFYVWDGFVDCWEVAQAPIMQWIVKA